jgi:DNA-binding NtrC family response regulator
MRAADLDLLKLLDVDERGGGVRFAGERALIMDTVAMGMLRKQLVTLVGLPAARAVLTRFGFAHGFRLAEAITSKVRLDSGDELQIAGGLLGTLQGFIRLAPGSTTPLAPDGAVLEASYEAEQHLLHLGRAEAPVCWTLSGWASGFVSRIQGEEIYVLEDRCIARGDAACRFRGRTLAGWGGAADVHLPFFREGGLDAPLHEIIAALRLAPAAATLATLQEHASALAGVSAEGGREPPAIVAESEAMRRALSLAERVAKVSSSVLLTGESGSGKERVARLIHDASPRAAGPFLAVNCAAIPESLLESELFGHARGSFTGAVQDRAGLFEAAAFGTLLLDEVGEITPGMQAKLLRVLQERQVRRVGENRSRPVHARILAATNRDLAADAASGRFRTDLYYRLRVVEIRLPPLRDRRDDIVPLARALLSAAGKKLGRPRPSLTRRAAEAVARYPWPGNVRELENAMEHAVALSNGDRIDLDDLPEEIRLASIALTPSESAGAGGPTRPALALAPAPAEARSLREIERLSILAALDRHGGNQTRAAAELGIGVSTLYRKLKSYGRAAGSGG